MQKVQEYESLRRTAQAELGETKRNMRGLQPNDPSGASTYTRQAEVQMETGIGQSNPVLHPPTIQRNTDPYADVSPTTPTANTTIMGSAGSQGSLPAMMMSAQVVDQCHPFAPSTYSQWELELRLWISGGNGSKIAQLLATIISVLQEPAKING